MKEQPVHTETVGTVRLKIYQDQDAEDPRTWDHVGTMVCWHSRHRLGDQDGSKEFGTPEDFDRWAQDHGCIMLPLYLYDHSGLTMSVAPFHCHWDSGQVGYIYVTRAKVLKEYGCKRITKSVRDKVDQLLRCEVQEYDQYLRGDVYGFVVEDADGNNLESCWGFFGFEYCKEEALSVAKDADKNLIGAGQGI